MALFIFKTQPDKRGSNSLWANQKFTNCARILDDWLDRANGKNLCVCPTRTRDSEAGRFKTVPMSDRLVQNSPSLGGQLQKSFGISESRVPCQVPLSSYIIQRALKRHGSGAIINFVPRVYNNGNNLSDSSMVVGRNTTRPRSKNLPSWVPRGSISRASKESKKRTKTSQNSA